MLKLKKIAVTGGIASGKSSVCRFLKEFGGLVVSSDEIVHKLLSPKTPLGKQIIDNFGPDIVESHRIDRKKLASKVFNKPENLKTLEKLIHPAVLAEIDKFYQDAQKENRYAFFVAEIPLLFEIQCESEFDFVIAVIADEKKCKQRFKEMGFSSDEYSKRMSRQLPINVKQKQADFVIENNGTYEQLKQQVKGIVHKLIPNNL